MVTSIKLIAVEILIQSTDGLTVEDQRMMFHFCHGQLNNCVWGLEMIDKSSVLDGSV